MCQLDANRNRAGYVWGEEYYKTIKRSKNSTIQGISTHFESEGKNYSYDNKGNFGIVDGSYVGQYANKIYNDVKTSKKAAF